MRLRRTPYGYVHPNGWVIRKWTREWSERVGAMRGASLASPRTAWEIHRHGVHPRRVVNTEATLREAREWCDKREAWDRPAPTPRRGGES